MHVRGHNALSQDPGSTHCCLCWTVGDGDSDPGWIKQKLLPYCDKVHVKACTSMH
jgi:hypothetical protein